MPTSFPPACNAHHQLAKTQWEQLANPTFITVPFITSPCCRCNLGSVQGNLTFLTLSSPFAHPTPLRAADQECSCAHPRVLCESLCLCNPRRISHGFSLTRCQWRRPSGRIGAGPGARRRLGQQVGRSRPCPDNCRLFVVPRLPSDISPEEIPWAVSGRYVALALLARAVNFMPPSAWSAWLD